MSKTIDEIKEECAKDFGFNNYGDVEDWNSECMIIDEVAERYAQSQTQELQDWKESASKVFKNLDLQAIGKTLGIGLGEDVSVNVLPKIKEIQEQNAGLVEILRHVVYEYQQGEKSYSTIREIKELLTRYYHLNKK